MSEKVRKKIHESVTLMLTFHPALSCVHEVLSRVVTLPTRVAFRNTKSFKDLLVTSKLKRESNVATDNCNRSSKKIRNL